MRLKIKAIIILAANIFASCTTNISYWEKNKLKWSDLPSSVQDAMIDATGTIKRVGDLTIHGGANPVITSLDKGIKADYEWINSGGGTGYHRLIINGNRYNLHSPAKGNEENEPFVLYEHKLYYLVTLNVNRVDELETAEFGYFDFKNKY